MLPEHLGHDVSSEQPVTAHAIIDELETIHIERLGGPQGKAHDQMTWRITECLGP